MGTELLIESQEMSWRWGGRSRGDKAQGPGIRDK